jgi:hypothetical protein
MASESAAAPGQRSLIRGERKFDEHQKTAVLRGVLAVCEQIANVPFNSVTAIPE